MPKKRLTPTTYKETQYAFVLAGIICAVFIWYSWQGWAGLFIWAILTAAVGSIFGAIDQATSERAFKRGYVQGHEDAKAGIWKCPVHPFLVELHGRDEE